MIRERIALVPVFAAWSPFFRDGSNDQSASALLRQWPLRLLNRGSDSVIGSLTGKAIETQDCLDFSVLTDVRPMIHTLPLAQAEAAYKQMMESKARFRMLTMS